jgi:two-component system KDP operon response regulator KdpE
LRHRMMAQGAQSSLIVQDVEIDLINRRVLKAGVDVHLTPKEYAILTELAKFPGRVITHDHLLKSVWGNEYERHIEYLRVVIRNLRQKIEDDVSRPAIIVNELGVGYRLLGSES